jgi:hypothetical protein
MIPSRHRSTNRKAPTVAESGDGGDSVRRAPRAIPALGVATACAPPAPSRPLCRGDDDRTELDPAPDGDETSREREDRGRAGERTASSGRGHPVLAPDARQRSETGLRGRPGRVAGHAPSRCRWAAGARRRRRDRGDHVASPGPPRRAPGAPALRPAHSAHGRLRHAISGQAEPARPPPRGGARDRRQPPARRADRGDRRNPGRRHQAGAARGPPHHGCGASRNRTSGQYPRRPFRTAESLLSSGIRTMRTRTAAPHRDRGEGATPPVPS